jgi:hypothetical protein
MGEGRIQGRIRSVELRYRPGMQRFEAVEQRAQLSFLGLIVRLLASDRAADEFGSRDIARREGLAIDELFFFNGNRDDQPVRGQAHRALP